MKRITQTLLALSIFFYVNGQDVEMTKFPENNINPTMAGREYLMNINEGENISGIENMQWEEGYLGEVMNIRQNDALKKSTMNDEYQLDSVLRYRWDEVNMKWKINDTCENNRALASKELHEYDANGNKILSFVYYLGGAACFYGIPPIVKHEYTYDTNGNQTLEIYYDWDTTVNDWVKRVEVETTYNANGNLTLYAAYHLYNNEWIGYEKYESTYDSSGNQTLEIHYDWDTAFHDWDKYYKYESTYDTNGNRTLSITYNWDYTANDWVGYRKEESTYDAYGNQTLYAIYSWDYLLNDWEGSEKYESTYDANGNQTLYSEYNWDNTLNDWVVEWKNKHEYTYDTNGNQTLEIHYDWDTTVNDWVISGKYKSTYDTNGNRNLSITYNWDYTVNDWVGYRKEESTYDAYGRTSYAIYSWDYLLNDWVGYLKEGWTYDAYGNQTLYIYIGYWWDETTNDWRYSSKTEWYYTQKSGIEAELSISEAFISIESAANSTATFEITSNTNWTVSGLEYWLTVDRYYGLYNATLTLTAAENVSALPRKDTLIISTDVLSDRYVYVTQTGSTVGINKQYAGDINIYPNPVGDILHIEGLQKETILSLYNANGQKIFSREFDFENGEINVSELPSGMYILKINLDDGVVVKRFAKE